MYGDKLFDSQGRKVTENEDGEWEFVDENESGTPEPPFRPVVGEENTLESVSADGDSKSKAKTSKSSATKSDSKSDSK